MDDFDIDALDNVDFDAVEKKSADKQAERDAKEAEEIKELRKGAGDCLGGSCTI